MGEISGKAGEVRVGGATVAGIRDWTVTYEGETIEVTDFGDSGWRNHILGLTGWRGTFNGFKDGAPQTVGAEAALILKESTTTGQQWTGQAIITGLNETVAVDGAVEVGYEFQGSGTLTPATA